MRYYLTAPLAYLALCFDGFGDDNDSNYIAGVQCHPEPKPLFL